MADRQDQYYLEEEEKPIDLKYYFGLIRKNLYVILTFFVITVTLAGISATKKTDRYLATAQLMIEKPQGLAKSSESIEGVEGQGLTEDYYNTQIEIMRSPSVLNYVVQELKLKDYYGTDNDDSVTERLKGMLVIKRIGNSRLFNLTVTADDARLTQSLANSIARAYIRKNFEDALYYSKEVLGWLPQAGGDPKEKITVEDPLGGMRQVTREDLIESLPALRTDQTLRALREKRGAMLSEIELMMGQFREKHPLMIKARSNLKFLDESIDNERTRIIENLKSQAEGKHRLGSARLIEEAKMPKAPLKNNRYQVIFFAGIIELVLSIIIIVLLDFFDDTIHSLEDFERKKLTNLPFLGNLPLVKDTELEKDKRALAGYYGKDTNIAEAFRFLRVAINFSGSPESLKTLVLSSCLPHEGKSFTSHNLAVSLALDGNRTLLVDADLRRPTLHNAFKIDNGVGLSNFLTSSIDLDSVTKESFVENLSVIPSGPMSPNPGEILGSDRMKQFVAEARKKYDRVIIDCPPLTGIGDAYVVGGLIGQLILVIASGRAPADLIRHTQKHLEKASIKILGVILNMVDIEKERHSGYSRHYYATYNRYYNQDNKGK